MKRVLSGIIFLCGISVAAESEWVWLYSKQWPAVEREARHQKQQSFVQLNTPDFSQLIFSWNAFRPAKGYFSFFVQARNNTTHQWYPMHHMMDWGSDIQRTYISVNEHGSSCYHVRLEMLKKTLADGFRVKVEAHGGADLSALQGLYVCVSNLSKFSEDSPDQLAQLKSVAIDGVPHRSQMVLNHPRANNLCSPTSLSMLLGFLTQSSVDPVACADKVYDVGLDSFGSWPFNVAHAFEVCGGSIRCYVARQSSFSELHKQLSKNVPVMVSVRGNLKGAAKPYENGHLLLVIGWDAQQRKVLCHDPAFESDEKTTVSYDINSFLAAWGRSRNLAYVVEQQVA